MSCLKSVWKAELEDTGTWKELDKKTAAVDTMEKFQRKLSEFAYYCLEEYHTPSSTLLPLRLASDRQP